MPRNWKSVLDSPAVSFAVFLPRFSVGSRDLSLSLSPGNLCLNLHLVFADCTTHLPGISWRLYWSNCYDKWGAVAWSATGRWLLPLYQNYRFFGLFVWPRFVFQWSAMVGNGRQWSLAASICNWCLLLSRKCHNFHYRNFRRWLSSPTICLNCLFGASLSTTTEQYSKHFGPINLQC